MAAGVLASGLSIGRPFGVTVRVHASWLLVFVLLLFSLATQVLPLMNMADGGPWWQGVEMAGRLATYERQFPQATPAEVDRALHIQRWPPWQHWALGLVGTLGLFVCVLAHELSHSLVARASGMRVEGITLFVFGGVSRLGDEPPSAPVEFKVAIAGPLVSLGIGGLCLGLYYGAGAAFASQGRALLFYFGFINTMLAAFNLLPGFPLDGGRVLRSILWRRYADLHRATAIASRWGKIFGAAFIALGVIQFAVTYSVASLWMVFIGLFLRYAAGAAYQQMAIREAFAGQTVRDLLQEQVVTVDPGLPLDRLVDDFFYRFRFRSFPVLEDGRLVGMVGLKDVQAVPRADWPATLVRDAMHRVADEHVVRPEDDLVNVLRKMTSADKGYLPVVVDGRLSGIVTRHDIMNLLHVRMELGEAPSHGARAAGTPHAQPAVRA